MSKYFLPPLLASFSVGVLFIPLNLVDDWEKYSSLDQIFNQIIGALVFTPFIYIIALPLHAIGCIFIEMLKSMNYYSLLKLLVSGFMFGLIGSLFVNSTGSFDAFNIIIGLSGVVAAWSYYSIDNKDRER